MELKDVLIVHQIRGNLMNTPNHQIMHYLQKYNQKYHMRYAIILDQKESTKKKEFTLYLIQKKYQ
jgi:hypothetical protein